MKTKQFRDLLVWRRSMHLAEAVYAVARSFPKDEIFGLSSQMRRAAVSVPSNIAEGFGRDSDRGFAVFLAQARGSLYELETQIEPAQNLGLIEAQRAAPLLADAAEVGRMLHGLRTALHHDVLAPSRSTR